MALIEKAADEASIGRFTCAYFAMQRRLSESKVKTGALTGVSWVQAIPTREKTVDIVVDIPMLQYMVSTGDVLSEDEYYVEILSTGLWSSGTIIEAFTFRVADILISRDSTADDSSTVEMIQQLKLFKTRLLQAETAANESASSSLQQRSLLAELASTVERLSSRKKKKKGQSAEPKAAEQALLSEREMTEIKTGRKSGKSKKEKLCRKLVADEPQNPILLFGLNDAGCIAEEESFELEKFCLELEQREGELS